MACVGRELLCALDFTFLQGTFLQGEVSLPRRGRKPEDPKGAPQRSRRVEWLLVRVRGTYIARAPELCSGALAIFAPPTGLDQTKLGVGAPAPAPNAVVTAFESRRENGKASERSSEAFSLAPPTGLELARRRFSERARNQKSLSRRGRKPEGLLVRV